MNDKKQNKLNYNLEELAARNSIADTQDFDEITVLITYAGSYTSLPENQRRLLTDKLNLRNESMLACEEFGLSVAKSVFKIKIMNALSVSLNDALIMARHYDSEVSACAQASIFGKKAAEYYWLQNDSALIDLLVSGHSARDVIFSKLASIALDTNTKNIIRSPNSPHPSDFDYTGISGDEAHALKEAITAYSLDPQAALSFILENNMTAADFRSTIERYQLSIGAFVYDSEDTPPNAGALTAENQTESIENGSPAGRAQASYRTETFNKGKLYPETPFTFNQAVHDGVNLNTGALAYEDGIARIPGRNGFDLNLSVMYDSGAAVSEEALGRLDGYFRHYYTIWANYTRVTSQQKASIESGTAAGVALALLIRTEAYAADNYFPYPISTAELQYVDSDLDYFNFPDIEELGGLYYLSLDTYAEYTFSTFETTYTENYTKAATVRNPMDYMGDGWSFKFDRIKKDTDTSEEILKLSNGASYR
ncbi:MAG: hypothetical protein LBB94_01080, partial [Clostridiales bacterium]|nr:hypothetical protein [Clostridiales bacterium]